MDLSKEFNYLLHPSYVDELHEFNSELAFSYQKEDTISPNSIQYDEIIDDHYMEKLLQMETELMNIDPINQETEQNVDVLTELAGNSQWKGVVEQVLMEESSLTDLLLTGAEAVEAENWPLATNVVAKLNGLLIDHKNGDDPFNRLALFFTQGLHFKIINGGPQVPRLQNEPVCTRQTESAVTAFQMLQELSPYVKFAHFTANQAILEATEGDQEVHVIDFDIMEGIQWPPLMADLAMRKDASLRITAIIIAGDQQNSGVVQQTGRRLREFADSINLPFVFDQMVMMREEDFEGIEVGHTVIANCMIDQFHMPNRNSSLIKKFLGGVTKLFPKVVVLVEEELFSSAKITSMSFVEFFCEAIHHYTALSDSLMSSSFCDRYKMGIRLIEKEILGIKILESLRREKNESRFWGNGLSVLEGYQPIPMSFCNVSQAKYLASLFSGGYWVQHEKCRLALCWKSRPLTTASIWVPISKPR